MKTKPKRRYAVVDLEATGTSATAKIIQVGIVLIEDGQIIETYATDVNPHEPLTEHIKSLTGITDAQLAEAPDFSQVAREIYSLLEGCVFVAHNVTFDANLLAEELFWEGYSLQTPRVDTVELAQVFFPTLEKYNLAALSEALDLHLDEAHTAIADAMATAELFLKLVAKIKSLPVVTLEKLLSLSDALLFETDLVISACLDEKESLFLPEGYLEQSGIVVKSPRAYRTPRKLSDTFETNLALLGLAERQDQHSFAMAVEACFEDENPSFIQAPAGIGKTYGYLLPLLAKAETQQLVVSVPTKVLQDQVLAGEGKALSDGFHLTVTSLKSPQNYISLDAFAATWQRPDNRLVNRYKLQVLVWLLETDTGDLDEIRQKQRFEAYFESLRHPGHLSTLSDFRDMDFWLRQQEAVRYSQLIVTNHAYLLARNADEPNFLAGKVLVIDEVQTFFLALEAFSQRSVNLSVMQETIRDQLALASHQLEKRLLESLAFEVDCLCAKLVQSASYDLTEEACEGLRCHVEELALDAFKPLKESMSPSFPQRWLERADEGIVLKAARVDFMNLLDALPPLQKLYGISATLDISERISLPFLLGLSAYTERRLPSVSDNQQLVAVPTGSPSIKALSEQDYGEWLVDKLLELSALPHPILVLFTSKNLLLSVSAQLDALGIKHLAQDKNGQAATIKRRFDKGEAKLLLGTGAFWEGVDFAQQDRFIVVVTRLPFEPPTRPLVQKITQYLQDKGHDPFEDYALPVMLLRLKQALGRSKRRSEQRSAVLLLDNRVLTATYGETIRQFLESEASLSLQNFSEILTEIADFLV